MAKNYKFQGKWKVGDVLHVLLRDYDNDCWDRGFYEIIECRDGYSGSTKGIYKVKKIAGEGSDWMNINVIYFDYGVMACYGNTKDGTLDPTLRVLYGG